MTAKDVTWSRQTSKSYGVMKVDGDDVTLSGRDEDRITLPKRLFPIPPREEHRVTVRLIVESAHTAKEWAKAYATQGKSDLDVYARLSPSPGAGSSVASCHWLHYLQMATEKIAKAFRFLNPGEAIETLLTSHAAAKEFVEAYFKGPRQKRKYEGKGAQLQAEKTAALHVARAIEELAPAVDRERVPQNVEYPWSDGVQLFVPCKHRFSFEDLPPHQIQRFVDLLEEVVADVLIR